MREHTIDVIEGNGDGCVVRSEAVSVEALECHSYQGTVVGDKHSTPPPFSCVGCLPTELGLSAG